MQFYPNTFAVGPDDREIQLQIVGRKGAGNEAQVRIVGVNSQLDQEELPEFTLQREAAGTRLRWDRPIEEEVGVVLYASSGLGQIQEAIRIGPPKEEEVPTPQPDDAQLVVGQPGQSISEGNVVNVQTLMTLGMTREEAVEALKRKLGLAPEVSESETTSGDPS